MTSTTFVLDWLRLRVALILRRSGIAPAVLLCTVASCTATSSPPTPQGLKVDAAINPPKLVRFVSSTHDGRECYGQVVQAKEGVPQQVRALPSRPDFDPCAQPPGPREAAAHLNEALRLLGNLDSPRPTEIEEITATELAERILAPVRVEQSWLDDNMVYIVGAGLNYFDHTEEAGGGDFVLFPKPIEPTGAYQEVPLTPVAKDKPVCLLDHEVEIAFVALKDIDLQRLKERQSDDPVLWTELISKLAFFAANDVTDRESQILDPLRGYTKAKARSGYLPTGPWLVAGWHLVQGESERSSEALALKLWTREAAPAITPFELRQDASSADMTVGVPEILKRLGDLGQCEEGTKHGELYCTMPDARKERHMTQGHTLPAGSIVLTGTPGGVAFNAPNRLDRALLFLRGGFSFEGAQKRFLADQERDRIALGYLGPGDDVKQEITHLGSQIWSVAAPNSTTTTGCS